jgi:hypothetical protein
VCPFDAFDAQPLMLRFSTDLPALQRMLRYRGLDSMILERFHIEQ